MNPRVSRSSALASKATGFPIAKLAALLAVGYTLDELPNDITGKSSAAFEPALDYVAVKAPRFDFAKFPWIEPALGTEMRAVGESLGLGRTFPEAFLKALEGREDGGRAAGDRRACTRTSQAELESIREAERRLAGDGDVAAGQAVRPAGLARSRACSGSPRRRCGARRPLPGRLAVDSCAAEFEARTPYYYLSYEEGDSDGHDAPRSRSVILGSGPNRIGQGIEFDYCCIARRAGVPRARLRGGAAELEPRDGVDRLRHLRPPLPRAGHARAGARRLRARAAGRRRRDARRPDAARLAHGLAEAGVPLLGDPLAGDRCRRGSRSVRRASSTSWGSARRAGAWPRRARRRSRSPERIGYPVLVRPHYVLGGPAHARRTGPDELEIHEPSLVDQFLEGALELDVDVLCDGESGWVAGILEHIEPAGVHSGDSACVIPGPSVTPALDAEIRSIAASLAGALDVRGLLNLQLALLERRAARDRGEPARVADGAVRGEGDRPPARRPRLPPHARRAPRRPRPARASPEPTRAWAKEAIFPSDRFPGAADRAAEMRSTGEVMAGGDTAAEAYAARCAPPAARAPTAARSGPSLQELAAIAASS